MRNTFALRMLRRLIIVSFVLLALHILMQYLNLVVFNEKQGQVFELSNRLDVDDEVSLPTWFSQAVLLAIGVTGLLVSQLEKLKSHKRAWKTIGIIGILFSIDEVGAIHELILQSAHLLYYGDMVPTLALNAWWLLLPIILVVGLGFLRWMYGILPRTTWQLFFAGGVMYLVGAVGFDLFSNDFSKLSYMYQGVMSAIEEGFEMIGMSIVLYGIVAYLESNYKTQIKAAWRAISSHDS